MIQGHIARTAPRAAAAFVRKLRDAVGSLRDFPELGSVVPELDHLGFREVLYGEYRILYVYSGRVVEIRTVRHGARLLDEGHLDE
jgi:toxin ParE1/3/4